jgi:FAD:protein FMN transferase
LHSVLYLPFVFAILFIFSACTAKKSEIQFEGIAMTIPYHIIAGNGEVAEDRAKAEILRTFEEVDSLFNKWNPESEIARFNRWGSSEPFLCSSPFYLMLSKCSLFFTVSQGRFDPTVEPLERVWVSALEKGAIPTQQQIDEIRPALGWDKVVLENGYIVKTNPKTALDLGGIAKGLAVDLLAERLAALGFASVYVEWGGEIRTHGPHPSGRPWKVGIRHPNDANKVLQILDTEEAALATSGDYLQYWTVTINGEKKRFFHVFDLMKEMPLEATSSSLASITVQYESCLVADAIAKTFLFAKNKEEAMRIFDLSIHPMFPSAKAWMFSHEEAEEI